MAAIRRAEVIWRGNLARGTGAVTAASSGAFDQLPVSWASRTEQANGRTSPEELLAAAHASCFSMALAFGLGTAGTPPEQLEVAAAVTFDQVEGGWRVYSSGPGLYINMLIRHALGVRRFFFERSEQPVLPKRLRKLKLAWNTRGVTSTTSSVSLR